MIWTLKRQDWREDGWQKKGVREKEMLPGLLNRHDPLKNMQCGRQGLAKIDSFATSILLDLGDAETHEEDGIQKK